jgi:cystathionine beta-lyase/cystathionine gamma-synthase
MEGDGRAFETRAARVGEGSAPVGRARPLAEPIYQTTVWGFDDLAAVDDWYEGRSSDTFLYYRNGNPNTVDLERAVADLEGAEAGVAAASGMAAIAGALLASLATGDHIVADRNVYGGTVVLLRVELARLGIESSLVESTDLEAVAAAWRPNTKVLHVESLSNPLLRCPDLDALADLAHARGAVFSVDNTFASPALLRPIEHGADVVTHSLAKYLGGHSVAVGGVAVGRRDLVASTRDRLTRIGGTIGALDAWLSVQGIKTLGLRMRAHAENGLAVGRALESWHAGGGTGRPLGEGGVTRVYYPGLASHPDHAVASRLFREGYGGMLSFDLGSAAAARAFLGEIGRAGIPFSPSLADVRTTVSYPAGTSHRALSAEERQAIGVTGGLIRLSVGIEAPSDILADLEHAVAAAKAGVT